MYRFDIEYLLSQDLADVKAKFSNVCYNAKNVRKS